MLLSLLNLVMPTIHKVVKDPNLVAQIEGNLKQLDHKEVIGQLAINLKQAEHKSIFVAGARPAIMWATGFQQVIWNPMLGPIFWRMMEWGQFSPDPVTQGINAAILFGLLGLRTIDKGLGTATMSLGSVVNRLLPGGQGNGSSR